MLRNPLIADCVGGAIPWDGAGSFPSSASQAWSNWKLPPFGTLLNEPADRPWGARMFPFKDLDGFKLGVSTPLKG